jgi:hypothetical protein
MRECSVQPCDCASDGKRGDGRVVRPGWALFGLFRPKARCPSGCRAESRTRTRRRLGRQCVIYVAWDGARHDGERCGKWGNGRHSATSSPNRRCASLSPTGRHFRTAPTHRESQNVSNCGASTTSTVLSTRRVGGRRLAQEVGWPDVSLRCLQRRCGRSTSAAPAHRRCRRRSRRFRRLLPLPLR